jgi:DNA primase
MKSPDATKIKSAISPREFYKAELPGMPAPKRDTGWTDGGLCPFHPDSHHGNFRVNLDSGAYTCFTCGMKGPDIISFTQTRYSLTFSGAIRALKDALGILHDTHSDRDNPHSVEG